MTAVLTTEAGAAATQLILETFRLNGRLLAAGDRLVAEIGLTSARWQVLGAIAYASHPGPVSHVARAMGLTRQNVRRIVGDLIADGLVRLAPNPNHRRAPLVLLTETGQETFAAAAARQAPWVNELSAGITPTVLRAALNTMRRLRVRLEQNDGKETLDAAA